MDRPFVSINMAASVDGKITSAGREYPRMTSRVDRDHMDKLRAESDAVLVGAGTLRADNPKLWVRSTEMQSYRRSLGHAGGLLKIVVTRSMDVDPQGGFARDEDGGGLLIATVEGAPADRVAAWKGRADVWQLGGDSVDLAALLRRLADRGVQRLLVEGGGELNWDFVRLDLVDELWITIAPTLLGGRDAPTLLEGTGFSMQDQRRLRLLNVHREGNELYTRWAVDRS